MSGRMSYCNVSSNALIIYETANDLQQLNRPSHLNHERPQLRLPMNIRRRLL